MAGEDISEVIEKDYLYYNYTSGHENKICCMLLCSLIIV